MAPKKIAVIGEKGGTGKSLVTGNLAVGAALNGFATVVIDLDPQTSTTRWYDRRKENHGLKNPLVVSAQASRLRQTEEAMAEADYIFVDVAGRSGSAASDAARGADLVLIPCSDDLVELETLDTVRDLLMIAGNPPALVLINCMHPSATKAVDDLRAYIHRTYNLVSVPVNLSRRDPYSDAWLTGHGVLEHEPDGPAAREIRRVLEFVDNFTTPPGAGHVENRRTRKAG